MVRRRASSSDEDRIIARVAFAPWVFNALVAACDDGTHLEACGALAGKLLSDGTLVVLHACGAGDEAARHVALCDYMPNVVQGWLNALTSLQPDVQLCGLWHLHPAGAQFSGTDARTYAQWVTDPSFNLLAAVFPIVGRGSDGSAETAEVYYADHIDPRPRPIPWGVLDWNSGLLGGEPGASALAPAAPTPRPRSSAVAAAAPASANGSAADPHSPTQEWLDNLRWQLTRRALDAKIALIGDAVWRIDVRSGGRVALVCLHNEATGECFVFSGEPSPSHALTLRDRVCTDLGRCLGRAAASRGTRTVARLRRSVRGFQPVMLTLRPPSSPGSLADGYGTVRPRSRRDQRWT